MSAQVTILQLPAAGAITGTEAVPIVQNGVTVQTTTAALAGSPVQTQTFLTVNQEATLNNSRYVGATNGLAITDGGAQGLFNISTTGALLSLVNSGTGFQVKTSSTALTGRSIAVSGAGLAITDGNGIAGDPTIALSGQVLNFANASFNGLMVLSTGGAITSATITGTASQIDVANGTGISGDPTISLSSDPVIPGTGGVVVPAGTTGQRGTSTLGNFRYNSTTGLFEGYNGAWTSFSSGTGVTSIVTGTGLTGGPITSTGTISIDVTGVTAASYGSSTQVGTFTVNAQGQLTAAANVAISASSIGAITTINGTANEITATGVSTVTLSLPAALTFTGKTVTGGTYVSPNISTIINSGTLTLPTSTDTLVGRATTDTLTNKSISGATNTLTSIANASLTNSSVTVGTTAIALGASSLTLGGLTTVTVTQDPTAALDLATKQYVDAVAQGLDPKASCVAATTANITLSGTQTIDGVALIAGDRCLVKDQTLSQDNGIYLVAAGAWTRATDMDSWAEVPGAFTFIEQGTLYADTGWVCTSNAGGTLGTTPITWVQFAGVGSYTAGTGLTLTGTQFSLTAPVTAALGGTGQTSYAIGDLLYASGTTTLSKLADVAIGNSLISGGVGVAPSWGKIGLVTHISGTLLVANGGTGLTAGTSGGIPYYSSTSAMTSSALLAANALMVGGGAGTAPSTVTTGTGVVTALGVAVGTAGAFVVNGGALGTPSSGTVTNLTGTASININGTVGATTPTTGNFTTATATTGIFGGTF